MSNLNLYISNLSWVFSEKVIRTFTSFITNILVINYIGPEIFGKISFSLAIVALLMGVSLMGLKDLLTSKLIQEQSNSNEIISTAFFIRFTSGIFCSVILVIYSFLFNWDKGFIFYSVIILSSTLIFQSFSVVESFFQANKLQKKAATALFLQNLLSTSLKLIFIFIKIEPVYILIIYFLEPFILALIYFLISRKYKLRLSVRYFSKNIAKDLIRLGAPLIFASITVGIYMNVDMIMLTSFISPTATGVYAAATAITGLLYFFPSLITATAFPAISKYNDNRDIQYSRISVLLRIFSVFGLLTSFMIFVFSDFIIDLLYSEDFKESKSVLKIQVFCFPFVVMAQITNMIIISHNLTKLLFYRSFASMLMNIMLNIIFIKMYGVLGAAVATLITHIFSSVVFDLFHNKTRDLFYVKLFMLNPKNLINDLKYIMYNLNYDLRSSHIYKRYSYFKKFKAFPDSKKHQEYYQQLTNTIFTSSKGILNNTNIHDQFQLSTCSSIEISIKKIKSGDKIYVCTDALENFCKKYLHKIDKDFVLISGDSDLTMEEASFSKNVIAKIANNKRVIKWYAQNLNFNHAKVRNLPIGMDFHTEYEVSDDFQLKNMPHYQEQEIINITNHSNFITHRDCKIYANWHFFLDRGDRRQCYESIDKELCFYEPARIQRRISYQNQTNYAFATSPHGEGFDCHRTYESILLGCIPIIKESPIAPLFKNLPVCIVKDWKDVNESLLKETLECFILKEFDYGILFHNYWRKNLNNIDLNYESNEYRMTMEQFRSLLNEYEKK